MQENYRQFLNDLNKRRDGSQTAENSLDGTELGEKQDSNTLTIADLCPNLMRSPSLYEVQEESESETQEDSDVELETDSTGSEDADEGMEICPELAMQALSGMHHVQFRRASQTATHSNSNGNRSRRSSGYGRHSRRYAGSISLSPPQQHIRNSLLHSHLRELGMSGRRYSTGSVSSRHRQSGVRSKRSTLTGSSRRSLTSHASSTRSRVKKKVKVLNGVRRYSMPQTWIYRSDFDVVKLPDSDKEDAARESQNDLTHLIKQAGGAAQSLEVIKMKQAQKRKLLEQALENFDLVHSLHMIKLLNFIKMFSKDKERLDIYQAVFDNPRRYCCLAFPLMILSEALFFTDIFSDIFFVGEVIKQHIPFIIEAWLIFLLVCPWIILWVLCGFRIKQHYYRGTIHVFGVILFLLFPYCLILPFILKILIMMRQTWSLGLYILTLSIPLETSRDELAFDNLLYIVHVLTQGLPMVITQAFLFTFINRNEKITTIYIISISSCIINIIYRYFTSSSKQIEDNINELMSYNLDQPLESMPSLDEFKSVYVKTTQI